MIDLADLTTACLLPPFLHFSLFLFPMAQELGFDYLRDNLATSHEQLVMRWYALTFSLFLVDLCDGSNLPCTNRPKPFHFAIVDEVDSVLIDEGRNPLLISGEVCLIVFLSSHKVLLIIQNKWIFFMLLESINCMNFGWLCVIIFGFLFMFASLFLFVFYYSSRIFECTLPLSFIFIFL